jgi:hypothetical protein
MLEQAHLLVIRKNNLTKTILLNLWKRWVIRLRGGIGFEIAVMGLQAMLASDVASFDARIQALRNAWSELSPLLSTATATEEAKKKLLNDLVEKLFNNKQYMDKYRTPPDMEWTADTEEASLLGHPSKTGWIEENPRWQKEQISTDILAFFDGIQLSHSPGLYLHLAAKASQDVLSNSPLVMSKALEEKGKLFRIPLSVGTYTQANLANYLDSLKSQIVQDATQPFAFMIGSLGHAIMLGYDPKNQDYPWCLIDANQLPPRYFSSAEKQDMAAMLYQAFVDPNHPDSVSISVTLYSTKPKQRSAIKAIASKLFNQKPWKALPYAVSINNPADNPADATTLLLLAAKEGHIKAVNKLISAGADVNQADDQQGFTPLETAAEQGHLEVVQALLAKGADVNQKVQGFPPLYVAAQNGHATVVETLLAKGADVSQEVLGLTPLQAAEARGHGEVVKVLSAHSHLTKPRPN